MTPREEALHRNQLVKQTVREVWQKDYEQEVLQLQEEASLLKISESSHAIMFQRSYNYKQMLHAAIEDVFTYHQPFKTPREDSKPVVDMSPPVKKKEDLSLSPASTHR
jgi:DNA uptake protein ComE-like DNA-binding protein